MIEGSRQQSLSLTQSQQVLSDDARTDEKDGPTCWQLNSLAKKMLKTDVAYATNTIYKRKHSFTNVNTS
ncbi:hypothetical protein MFFC18_19890 [Mariniblastus fucicola]|uniref:Uncharacterized protein n=1 Tax=Mariniblastus fucicola TaxID=980251 RepID=A0A5B9P759_9BACT|nr:hypothetical protein MFFC18_19890 [Mariniblastus fucicola]